VSAKQERDAIFTRFFEPMAGDKQRTLYSLDPNYEAAKTASERFSGWAVLGKVDLSEADAKTALDQLWADVEGGRSMAMCFQPRHGLTSEGGLQIVICFECAQAQFREDGAQTETLAIGSSSLETLNTLLRAQNIPIAD
jgi:hypothetical protein